MLLELRRQVVLLAEESRGLKVLAQEVRMAAAARQEQEQTAVELASPLVAQASSQPEPASLQEPGMELS